MTPEEISALASEGTCLLRRELDNLFLCPRRSFDLDRVLLMLASKALRLTDAIALLARNGFYGEAFGLCRSALEAFLIAKFVSNASKDPEGRARSYIDFIKAHYYN